PLGAERRDMGAARGDAKAICVDADPIERLREPVRDGWIEACDARADRPGADVRRAVEDRAALVATVDVALLTDALQQIDTGQAFAGAGLELLAQPVLGFRPRSDCFVDALVDDRLPRPVEVRLGDAMLDQARPGRLLPRPRRLAR